MRPYKPVIVNWQLRGCYVLLNLAIYEACTPFIPNKRYPLLKYMQIKPIDVQN